jgi:hypothetical protein
MTSRLSAKNQPINRGLGRRRLSKKALFYQLEHYNEILDDEESDNDI